MTTHGVKVPPGPSLPIAIQTLAMGLRQDQFMAWALRRFGDPFTIRMPQGRTLVMFSNPVAIKQIFSASPDDLHAGESTGAVLEPFVGTNSLLLLDGARHLKERRMMMPSFHGERMATYVQVMADATRRDMATWPLGEPFAMRPHTQTITLDVIMRAIFGVDDEKGQEDLRRSLHVMLTSSMNPQLLLPVFRRRLGGLSPWARFLELRKEIDAALFAEIDKRRQDPDIEGRGDILSMLIQARYEDGAGLNDRDLRDELITLLLAGHETTATSLAWAFDLLLHHPEVMTRLQNELAAGDDTYLDAVIKEVLRVRPVVPQVGRKLKRPMEFNGTRLPEGVIAVPNIILTHQRPDIYPEPERFRPERFIEKPADTYTWIPFGGGTRRCLGAAFATTEMKVVLKTVLAEARLSAADPRPEPIARRMVTMVPKHGTRVVLEERLIPAAPAPRPRVTTAA
ncbi:MAG TPA: cytochrome P450 [Candidatus Dormibacteraeota bacterium]|nr:cytochrome P450 [Candidatus Dormibacteraeota bacterium]